MRGISLDSLLGELAGVEEVAVLDVREAAVHSSGHLPRSVPAPLARLELAATRLIPRRSTPIILIGDAPPDPDRLAMRAMGALAAIGYRDIRRLEGGLAPGDEAAGAPGRRLLTGRHALGLAFVEWLAGEAGLATVSAAELAASGSAFMIADLGPEPRFRRTAVPGSLLAPGLELVPRVLAAGPDRPVAVVGAGRADSMMGALWLAAAGLGRRAVALDGGLAAWTALGLPVEAGSDRILEPPSPEDLPRLAAAAGAVAPGPVRVGWADIRSLREDPSRNLILLDLRPPEDYRAAHPPGFRSVDGLRVMRSAGDLLAVRGATVVLHDDCGLRAAVAAGWLSRMGWPRVRILGGGRIPVEEGRPRDLLAEAFRRYLEDKIPQVGTEDALDLLEAGAVLVQVAEYGGRAGAGAAAWPSEGAPAFRRATRATLPRVLDSLSGDGPGRLAILTSDDPLDASLAASEMIRLGRPSLVLDGPPGEEEVAALFAAFGADPPRREDPPGREGARGDPEPPDPDDGPEQLLRLLGWPELASGRGPGGFGG